VSGSLRFCRDCRWLRLGYLLRLDAEYSLCNHAAAQFEPSPDLVTGYMPVARQRTCLSMRSRPACGPEGRLFEPGSPRAAEQAAGAE